MRDGCELMIKRASGLVILAALSGFAGVCRDDGQQADLYGKPPEYEPGT